MKSHPQFSYDWHQSTLRSQRRKSLVIAICKLLGGIAILILFGIAGTEMIGK